MGTELPPAAGHTCLSGLLFSTEAVGAALALVTALAEKAVPHTDGAGVTLRDERGERVTTAATDPLVEQADGLQYAFAEGPCLTAWDTRTLVRVDDLTREDRWTRWSAASAATGVRAALSAPLVAGEKGLGTVKLYSRLPRAYGRGEERLLTVFAAHAAVLLAHTRTGADAKRVRDELRASVRGRDLVNVATGILMEREAVDGRTADLLLAEMARAQGRPVHGVAEAVAGATVRRRR